MTILVIGLGQTGQAAMQYFQATGIDAVGCDTRDGLPGMPENLTGVTQVIVSPGVSLEHPWVQQCYQAKLPVISDIQYFVDHNNTVPIIAITGTNGKSTVTKLVADLLTAQGYNVCIGGNYGLPVMTLLSADKPDFYVLELSSFQLEITPCLNATVACLLNITPDHLERHGTLEAYAKAKAMIFNGARFGVVGQGCLPYVSKRVVPVVFDAVPMVLPSLSASLAGDHNRLNVQAAIMILSQLNIDVDAQMLRDFKGLPHRCVLVTQHHGVRWINDSKATNVGATIAAIEGLAPSCDGRIMVLLGGVGKDQDFSPLLPVLQKHQCQAIVYGEAADTIAKTVYSQLAKQVTTLEQAVVHAQKITQSGDIVLLAPACASFDQFENFADRGWCFERLCTPGHCAP